MRDGIQVAKVAADVIYLGLDPVQGEAGDRRLATVEGDHGGPIGDQRLRQPGPDEAMGTGDERLQATCSSLQTRQGGSPVCQRSLRSTASL